MNDLPDAPWIRDAERDGVPTAKRPRCPCCGEDDAEEFYVDYSGAVLGCDSCLKSIDPFDWLEKISS